MAKKKEKIAPTLEQPKEEPTMITAPVEIHFHIAGANVQKVMTPSGMMTTLSLISPTGLAVSVNLSDDNIKELVKDLQGSKIEIASTMPL